MEDRRFPRDCERNASSTHRDRTSVEERERTLRAIADNVDAVIFAMDRNATFTLSRGRALKRLGLKPDQVVGVDGRSMYAAHPPILEGIDAALAGEHRRVVERVEGVVFDISFAPDIDEAGDVVGLVGIGYDITPAVEAAEELASARDIAEQASRAKTLFLASMSHELRTPLNSIIGFSSLLAQGLTGPLTEEQQRQIEMINAAGRVLLSLVGDVLDLAKFEAGQTEVNVEPIDLPRLLSSLADSVRPLVDEKGLTLCIEIDDAPTEIVSDRLKLQQVLLNLLSNAINYTARGSITVACERASPDTVSLSVRDTGVGIAPDDLNIIFEEFRQLPATGRTKAPGTGLGLSIVERLVRLLGGTVEVESEVGRGSIFTVVLPLELDVER